MLGYTRFSAYNLTSDDLSNVCNKLLAVNHPIIGYSSALDRFVRQNSHRASDLAQLAQGSHCYCRGSTFHR